MTRRIVRPRGTTLRQLRPRSARKRKYRKEFSGKRYETQPVSEYITSDNRRYIVRQDGSKVPDHTTISVSQSIREIYSEMCRDLQYNNYDELLLDLAKRWLRSKKTSHNENTIAKYENLEAAARIDCRLRQKAREKAIAKNRYFW